MSETPKRQARIYYARVDEFWRKEEKYALLKELKVDEHIPLIAINHADRILKKIK